MKTINLIKLQAVGKKITPAALIMLHKLTGSANATTADQARRALNGEVVTAADFSQPYWPEIEQKQSEEQTQII